MDAEKLSLKTMKQVLEEKLMNGNNKEETWSLIETPLLSFLEKTFGSKLIVQLHNTNIVLCIFCIYIVVLFVS